MAIKVKYVDQSEPVWQSKVNMPTNQSPAGAAAAHGADGAVVVVHVLVVGVQVDS